jgi:hypothetical protein
MRLRTTTLAAACALALLAPPVARADHGEVVNDPTFDQYMRIAAEYWGGQQPQCNGPNGQAIAPHAVYADNPDPAVGAWAEVPGCRIWLDRTHWPAPPKEQHCNLIAHEWGHLLGQEHSQDQASLMWGSWINNVAPGCTAFRPQPPVQAPTVAAAPAPKKTKKLHEKKTRRGRQRCIQVRRLKVRRRSRVAKHVRRVRGKRCKRKRSPKHRRRHAAPAPVTSIHSLARLY